LYELFEHTADLGLRIKAATLDELLVEAARGLLAMHVANPATIKPVQDRTISLAASDPSYLLFDWLSELLYIFETEKLLLCEFEVQCGGEVKGSELRLTATCRGELMDNERHEMDHEVKAITYHGLKVEQTPQGWFAEVIVDI
jgi:SHS2 domain-containing protein